MAKTPNRRDTSPDRSLIARNSDGAEPRPLSRVMSFAITAVLFALVGGCCACGVFLYRQWPSFEQDPTAAQTLTRELLSIDIPDVFRPEGLITWQVWFLLTMQGAYYSHSIGEGELAFISVQSRFLTQPDFRTHIIDSLHKHGAGGGLDLKVMRRETRTVNINQVPVEFEFLAAEDRTTGRQRRLMDGVVEGKSGPVLISLWTDADVWDEEAVIAMLESIGRDHP